MTLTHEFMLAGATALGLTAAAAQADSLPDSPITLIVPFAAGGPADVVARTLANAMQEASDHIFVVENRPGAAGLVAALAVRDSHPDGRTIFVGSATTMSVLPAVRAVPFDPIGDFRPVALLGSGPYVMLVNAQVP